MTQRTWFITGVNSGFGRQMTEQLLAHGDQVAGTVRKMDTMNDLKAKYGDLLWLANLDMTDTSAIRQVVNQAFTDLGKIEVVINNAGYGLFGAVEALTDEQIIQQINTNLIGSIQVVRASLPHLREQGGGRIIQVSSYGGQVAQPGGSIYHASKWGIEGFMESFMQEIAPFNIGVTIVEPGGSRTQFRSKLLTQAAPELDDYKGTPTGMVHNILQDKSRLPPGDPAKMAKMMIDSVDQNPAPKRLVLGSDAYAFVHKALSERLVALEAQKNMASLTDITQALPDT